MLSCIVKKYCREIVLGKIVTLHWEKSYIIIIGDINRRAKNYGESEYGTNDKSVE